MADQAMIDLGKQQAREDLNNIAQWIADNKFPGYSERVEEISLPKWMLPKEDGTLLITSPLNFTNGWTMKLNIECSAADLYLIARDVSLPRCKLIAI